MRRWISRRYALVVGCCCKCSERICRNVAWAHTNVSRCGIKWRVSIGITRWLECGWRHGSTINTRSERLCEDSLIATPSLWRGIRRLLRLGWTSFALCSSANTNSTGANATGSLETKRWTGERCRVDGRHPNSGLVDLEKICYQGVEVDVSIGKVVECKLLPIPSAQSARVL